jgi:hypothetical protein
MFRVSNNMTTKTIKNTIQSILSIMFPFKETPTRNSVFMWQTWLEKNTDSLHVKDYIWTPSFKR